MILNIDEICRILPHAHPFVMIDQVEIIEPGCRVKGTKAVTYTENVFHGHFPGNAILPGSLIIEAAAQTAGFLIYGAEKQLNGFLVEVKAFRFSRQVKPGILLCIEVEKEMKKGPFLLAGIRVSAGSETVAEGQLQLYIEKQANHE